MNSKNSWSELLLMANQDLQKAGKEIEVVKNSDDYYTVNIKNGEQSTCFADNFFEEEMPEVINDAWANARTIDAEKNKNIFIVTHVTISSSEPNANGYMDVKAFSDKEKATRQLKTWREDELQLRRERGCPYEIYDDTETKFHCTWDSDLEGIIITLNEVPIS